MDNKIMTALVRHLHRNLFGLFVPTRSNNSSRHSSRFDRNTPPNDKEQSPWEYFWYNPTERK
jgi:hypothetical protein